MSNGSENLIKYRYSEHSDYPMSDEIYFDGVRFLSTVDAAARTGFSRDYIYRLCKEGQLAGRRIGKSWYVDNRSLDNFVLEQHTVRSRRREDLSKTRADEYQRKNQFHPEIPQVHREVLLREPLQNTPSPVEPIHHALARAVVRGAHRVPLSKAHVLPTYALTPVAELLHKVTALALALMLTFGTYAAVDPSYARFAADSVRESVGSVLDSYRGLDELAARTQSQVAAVAENPQAAAASVGSVLTESIPSAGWRIAARLARALNSGVNELADAIAFPLDLVGPRRR